MTHDGINSRCRDAGVGIKANAPGGNLGRLEISKIGVGDDAKQAALNGGTCFAHSPASRNTACEKRSGIRAVPHPSLIATFPDPDCLAAGDRHARLAARCYAAAGLSDAQIAQRLGRRARS